MEAVKRKRKTAIIGVIAALLTVVITAIAAVCGYNHSVRSSRYNFCLADDAFAKAWFSGELTPSAEGHNELVDGMYVAGEYTTYYFGTGVGVSYVTEYKDSDLVLIYDSGSDHIRQYDGGELTSLSVGEFEDGRHTFTIYPVS